MIAPDTAWAAVADCGRREARVGRVPDTAAETGRLRALRRVDAVPRMPGWYVSRPDSVAAGWSFGSCFEAGADRSLGADDTFLTGRFTTAGCTP